MNSALQPGRDTGPLSESDAEVYVASVCFKTGPPGAAGVEVERLVHDAANPRFPVPVARVSEAVAAGGRLPGQGVITFEPGGQLEISSACATDLPALVTATRADLAAVESLLTDAGLCFGAVALDPDRLPVRSLDHPRYAAMEQHFDRFGTAGRTMMCSTASLQISLDAGFDSPGSSGAARRWERLHNLLPVLVAMFANSPFLQGVPSGWKSNRQRIWLAMDPTRTAAVPLAGDPRVAWAGYALDALVLCIRSETDSWTAPRGLTMRNWLRGEGPRPATMGDLAYHLTTLFPPVRPRGFVEIRVIDAQAGSDWEPVTAIVTALMDDQRAADLAAEACAPLAPLSDPVRTAARHGLADPLLASAALDCAEAALMALSRSGADAATRSRTEEFVDRYTARGRCPADERLDRWQKTGSYFGTSAYEEDCKNAR
ncbi:ergothioneine biosynthesis glutamate--cysteine ligase EgtA [Arthrobacter sp. B2a2-09]|uniref:ergothioneine biosynthesis glutamate--cysteine ligase EgtA n=1 Tax=Arthrobacter sp. B2a2-09 TaxID=2952822 RepID=UPI0022CD7680|nr:ergothioneine biosynthesis glutamate--cysteine ligase EgtA [Arthrobacter sp. B2a2-09]MCZ9880187.1 ergothioneine biosynthesis glutamate--cysteine ligase EgtA [Arthrobacter sp. B2a2-09]